MELNRALEIQEILTDKYLFANIGRYAYAGDDENSYYSQNSIDDNVLTAFESIDAVGIFESDKDDYKLEFYHSSHVLYSSSIAESFNLDDADILFVEIESFEFHSKRMRPLRIGSSIGHASSNGQGTLGCFVSDDQGNKYVLSNYHVLYYPDVDSRDDFIIQPGILDGGDPHKDSIGLLGRFLSYDPNDVNLYDAALAGPLSVDIDKKIPINGGQKINGTETPSSKIKVYKYGAESGLTNGEIRSFNTNAKVRIDGKDIAFKNLISIRGWDSAYTNFEKFSIPGDSGSIIIGSTNHNAIGLLFAGSNSGVSLAMSLEEILTQLNVALEI